jgi:hypothetical protein
VPLPYQAVSRLNDFRLGGFDVQTANKQRKTNAAETISVQVLPPAPTAPPERDVYLSVREAADFARISEISVRRLLTKKRLRRFKCGARTLVLLRDLQGLIHEA